MIPVHLPASLSLDEYVRQRQIELARDLERKKAIYLDIKFWIILRDVVTGRQTGSSEVQLLHLLRNRVTNGQAFCPVSDSTFGELLKQSDPHTRKATAGIIDELSQGVAIIPFELRVGTELAHFIHAMGGANDLYPLKLLVWSKLSYVLGFVHPTGTGFEKETELVLQKEVFDHMWTISMSEMIDRIGDAMPPSGFTSFALLADRLNVENAKHASEIRSFEQAYLAEIQGAIDSFAGIGIDIIGQMFENRSGHPGELSASERLARERELKNLLFATFKQSSTKDALRTLHISACMHAFVRWNKQQQLKANDFFDFRHATAALGYCDAFLTERSMQAMVSAGHLSLDSRYGCRVIADVNDAIDYMEALPRIVGNP